MTVALGEDQRVIGSSVDLDLDKMLDIVKVLAADTLDLRHAAEAVVKLFPPLSKFRISASFSF